MARLLTIFSKPSASDAERKKVGARSPSGDSGPHIVARIKDGDPARWWLHKAAARRLSSATATPLVLNVLCQKITSFPTGFSQGCGKYQHPTTYLGLLSFTLRWRDLIGIIMIKSSFHDQGTSGFFVASRSFALDAFPLEGL